MRLHQPFAPCRCSSQWTGLVLTDARLLPHSPPVVPLVAVDAAQHDGPAVVQQPRVAHLRLTETQLQIMPAIPRGLNAGCCDQGCITGER